MMAILHRRLRHPLHQDLWRKIKEIDDVVDDTFKVSIEIFGLRHYRNMEETLWHNEINSKTPKPTTYFTTLFLFI